MDMNILDTIYMLIQKDIEFVEHVNAQDKRLPSDGMAGSYSRGHNWPVL